MTKQVSAPVVILLVVVLIGVLLFMGRWLLRPRMPEAPPELRGRANTVPGGSVQPGGVSRRLSPGRAPD